MAHYGVVTGDGATLADRPEGLSVRWARLAGDGSENGDPRLSERCSLGLE
jgi:hypothetical protein